MSQNIRILVIEDEKNIQNFITSVLNSQHYQVISSLTFLIWTVWRLSVRSASGLIHRFL